MDTSEFDTGENLVFLRPGYQKRVLKRLRRGHYGIADSIDLHHMNQHTAQTVLLEFLAQSVQRGLNCVRVVHGKGRRSLKEPRLKIMTRQILSQHSKVVAFISSRPAEGGTGAVDVLLSPRKENLR